MKLIFVLLCLIFCVNLFSQKYTTNEGCNLFENLNYKNGVDTIKIKATYLEMVKMPDCEVLKKLEKEGKLKSKDFGYAISFKPLNCDKEYYISSKDTSDLAKMLFDEKYIGVQVTLICVVFDNYKLWDYPFFIVERIELE